MGYFSNGTEGALWEAAQCTNCLHLDAEKGCPILLAHYMGNYDQCERAGDVEAVTRLRKMLRSVLCMFIPYSEDTGESGDCAMFKELPK